jgi:hypothetical protein
MCDVFIDTAKLGVVSEEADESVFWLERMARAHGAR